MLYIIPTPIGNREDVTLRALRLFKELDFFICEDTRTFKNLLRLLEVDYTNKKFHSYTSYTKQGKIDFFKTLISEDNVGLVSESWMPGFSDPWKELIKLCWENDIKFEVLPWANALLPLVVSSYFDTSKFVFLWFLPKKKWRKTIFEFIKSSEIPVFIYESPYRIEKTLNQLKDSGFEWKVSLGREISKKFEQIECDDIDTILSKLSDNKIKIKWEFVLWFCNI